MKIPRYSLRLTAAFAGLVAGTMTNSIAAPASSNPNPTISSASQFAATDDNKTDKKADKKTDKDKNSCKGKGGCGSDSPKKDKKQ